MGGHLGPLTFISLPPDEHYQSPNPSQKNSSGHCQPNCGSLIQGLVRPALLAFCGREGICGECRRHSGGTWSDGLGGWEERK